MWYKSSISQGELDALRLAAARAWDEDTRDARWEHHPIAQGQCYVTAHWLVNRLGGGVGRRAGHFVWLSPGQRYAIDLACGAHSYEEADGYRPYPIVDTVRAARFSKRADRIFDHMLKVGDMIGDAYPGEEPERDAELHQDDPGTSSPYWHDEPGYEPSSGVYKLVYSGGQLEISPDHDHTDLAQHAGLGMGEHAPVAVGYVSVQQGKATFEVQTNINVAALQKPLKDYCKTVGWQWGGITNIEGEPISDEFGPSKTSRLTYVYDESANHLWVGRTTRSDLAARADLGRVSSAGRLYLSGRGEVAVDRVDPVVLPHLFEWVNDNGFTLYALNDNTLEHYEDLQQHNMGDPKAESNLMSDSEDDQAMRTPAGLYECPSCQRLFPNWREYAKHRRDDEAHVQEPEYDGKFPLIDSDSPFGDGAHWTENRQEPGIHTGAMKNPLWESADDDPYVYHAAPTSERDRIQTHGLQPSLPAQNPRWDEWAQDRGIEEQPRGIYVAPTWQTASGWLRPTNRRAEEEPHDIWRIRKDDVTDYARDPLASAHQYITHPVSAELHKGWEDVMPYEDWKAYQGESSWMDQTNEGIKAERAIEENPQWGVGRPDRVIGRTATRLEDEREAQRVDGFAPVAADQFYVAYQDGCPVGYAAVRDNKLCAARMVRDVRGPLLRAVARGTGQEHKDLLEEPVPFIYDVDKDKIHIGQPGQDTMAIQPPEGAFTPGGIVEGLYEPGGKMVLLSTTNIPFTVRHMVELWYNTYPTLEVKSVTMKNNDKDLKLATARHAMERVVDAWTRDPAAWLAAKHLQQAGGEVYVVGGAVRDALRGKEPEDIDLLVRKLPKERVAEVLKGIPVGRLDFTGKDFGVFRFKHHTAVEIALPRREHSSGVGHKDFDVKADEMMEVVDDLYRRDFTINAMAISLADGRLIDPLGGVDDVGAFRLRATSATALGEDPLRIVRGLVAIARFGFLPDEQTLGDMRKYADSLKHLPPERIRVELDKLMEAPNPADGILWAHVAGVLGRILPEVEAAMGYDQNNPHHERELGDHLIEVLRRTALVTPDKDVRLAALLHDIGKPASQWTDPETGKSHFYEKHIAQADGSTQILGADHERVGGEMVRHRMEELRYSNARIERVTKLVEEHMWHAYTSEKGARKFLARVGDHADDLLLIRWADNGGKAAYPTDSTLSTEKQAKLIEQVRMAGDATEQRDLAINGRDLIGLGIPEGPEIGRVLAYLTTIVIDEPELNDRDRLLRAAKLLA